MRDMTGLKASILEQSHTKGRAQLAAAKTQAAADFEQKKNQLLLEKEADRRNRISELTRRVQKERQQLENQARQTALQTKQTVLQELFQAAEAEMRNWPEAAELDFFNQVMAKYPEPVRVCFGQLTAAKLSASSRSALNQTYPQVSISEETIPGEAGFVISQGKVDDNYLYSSLMEGLREAEGFRLAADIFQTD